MQALTAATIQGVKGASIQANWAPNVRQTTTRSVFVFTMTDNERLVVKAEARGVTGRSEVQQHISVHWSCEMMKLVSPNINVHEVSAAELGVLKGLGAGKFHDDLSRRFLSYMLTQTDYPMTWHKMDFVLQLTNIEDMVKNHDGPLALLALKSNAVMTKLGAIYAVDLFVGNHDRFRGDGEVAPANIFLRRLIHGYEP